MSGKIHFSYNLIRWRGFTLQFFLITVLPLTALLLVVSFGSQMLHHDAMRSLVGDRDLMAARAAAFSLEQELSHRANTIQILADSVDDKNDGEVVFAKSQEISTLFNGGLALINPDGNLIMSTPSAPFWSERSNIPKDVLSNLLQKDTLHPIFSLPIDREGKSHKWVLVGTPTLNGNFLIGAFSPEVMIQNALRTLISAAQITSLVISPGKNKKDFEILFQSGKLEQEGQYVNHPGIAEALNGESGINYFQMSEGEHVVAFSPIAPVGWDLMIEESWEDVASPYLRATQAAPLVIVPVFLLALVALWFGASRIVQPLQELEKQAASLAKGNFEAVRKPVGGISEIRNLQAELIDMADKLKEAQQSLHNYIGSITGGIENERRNLARELHDDTIQSLIALNQRIQFAVMNNNELTEKKLAELQGLVQQMIVNLRRMIAGLRPIYLEDLGLVTALDMLTHEIRQLANIPVSFQIKGVERRLDAEKEMGLYRMVQESLSNVVRHAHASQAWVELNFTPEDLSIIIRDNGSGFVVPSNPLEFSSQHHFGLLGLQERAEIIGAHLEISSAPKQGTKVTITLSPH
ncbi:MAG: sensor histidine kinase [Chloroflexota bacterium]